MIKVIGVRFRTAGKIYFFDPVDFEIEKSSNVIVETARGIEYGTVVCAPKEVEDEDVIQPLKPVLRIANQKDLEQEEANKVKEKEAFIICLEKIRKHGLEMKLIDAEYTFDNNKVLFYFTADGRIDFRELVKDLAGVFKTRIELRQIGVRDETKIVGGIGICGRPLCCHTHLSEFVPVSIKMAKEQNLSLNPTKISGVCGRLMCCLKHEEETYEELNRRLPGVGDTVTTEDGLHGEVHSVNVLRQLVKVIVDANDEKEIHEYKVDDLKFRRKHTKKERLELSEEELKELEKLEAEEKAELTEEKNASKEDRPVKRDNRNRLKETQDKSDESENRQEKRGNRRFRNDRRDSRQNEERQDNNKPVENRSQNQDNTPSQNSGRNQDGNQRQTNGQQDNQGPKRRNFHQSRNNHYKNGKREGKTDFESNQS
ncbi:MAG TPA: regulatory iron-sulfur-containing complex subunit RicT [Lachnospiraceae bacterium]|nr:regulatory iron-sulfur-containing complex subunit RicT [Lachnospiraceae bacterium]